MKVTFSFQEGQKNMAGKAETDNEQEVLSLWVFRCRHMTLMIAYVQAGAPDFSIADMATMLEYHEWIMEKAHKHPRPHLQALIEADFKMRAEWMLGYTTGAYPTLTAAVKHHRSESNWLFSNLPTAGRDPGSKRQRSGGQSDGTQSQSEGGAPRGGKGQEKGKETSDICRFYNLPKGCARSATCTFRHVCNVKGCQDRRPAHTHH